MIAANLSDFLAKQIVVDMTATNKDIPRQFLIELDKNEIGWQGGGRAIEHFPFSKTLCILTVNDRQQLCVSSYDCHLQFNPEVPIVPVSVYLQGEKEDVFTSFLDLL